MYTYVVVVSFDHFRVGQVVAFDVEADFWVRAGYLKEVDNAAAHTMGPVLLTSLDRPVGRRRKKVTDGVQQDVPDSDPADGPPES